MNHLKLTIEDIMQPDILFFDEDRVDACIEICKYLKIDRMPAIDGEHFYEFDGQSFSAYPIAAEQKVNVNEDLFNEELTEQFAINKHNVLFVFEGNVLRGVVHISDYNRDKVLQAIQDDMLSFERKLRQLLLLNGFSNDTMMQYLHRALQKEKKEEKIARLQTKIDGYKQRQKEMDALAAFQLFDFSELLMLASSSVTGALHKVSNNNIKTGSKQDGSNYLIQLRNMAMHAKNPVHKDESSAVYSCESLETFFTQLALLRSESALVAYKIMKHPDWVKSVKLDNQNKLDIIYNHHPRALEYFLGF